MNEQAGNDGFALELRVRPEGLVAGMFVSRLDRPWQEAGFAIEGWMLRSDDDVRRVRSVCRYVHVDVLRGKSPDSQFVILDDDLARQQAEEPSQQGVALEVHAGSEQGASVPALRWTDAQSESADSGPRVAADEVSWPHVEPLASNRSVFDSAHAAAQSLFGEALASAQEAKSRLESGIRDAMAAVSAGAKIDTVSLQQSVDAMLDSLDQHPGAMPWVLAMQRKDDYIYRHGLSCAIWAATFGRHLGLERSELRELSLAALLLDVGKVRIDGALLTKKGPLNPQDLEHLRGHVKDGHLIVVEAGVARNVARVVELHHERFDGSGYPHGMKGAQIPLAARIAGLVDTYDAITSERGYAARRSPHQAVMELYQLRDRLFEAALVEQFIRTCGVYPTGTLVELTDGRVGVVMAVNSLSRLRPTLMMLLGSDKKPLPRFVLLDLSKCDGEGGTALAVKEALPINAYGLDPTQLFLD